MSAAAGPASWANRPASQVLPGRRIGPCPLVRRDLGTRRVDEPDDVAAGQPVGAEERPTPEPELPALGRDRSEVRGTRSAVRQAAEVGQADVPTGRSRRVDEPAHDGVDTIRADEQVRRLGAAVVEGRDDRPPRPRSAATSRRPSTTRIPRSTARSARPRANRVRLRVSAGVPSASGVPRGRSPRTRHSASRITLRRVGEPIGDREVERVDGGEGVEPVRGDGQVRARSRRRRGDGLRRPSASIPTCWRAMAVAGPAIPPPTMRARMRGILSLRYPYRSDLRIFR